MEVDNWQIDINATESSTKDASELERQQEEVSRCGYESGIRNVPSNSLFAHDRIIFWTFWGGICVATVERLIPNMTGDDTGFPAGHHGFKLRCADSHLSLFRLPVHTGQTEPNEAKKKIWYTHVFFLQCSLKWGYQTLVAGSKNRMAGVLLGVGKLCPSGDHQLTGHILSES